MAVKEVKQGDLILARHIPSADAWQGDLNFFSPDEDYIQVGTWGYDSGKELLAHTHNEVTRNVLWTQETLYIRKGRILVQVYNTEEVIVDEWEAAEGDIVILLRGGHGYHILEDGTQVLEVKNGPYVGADKDRRRL